jgi:hypothetical protein
VTTTDERLDRVVALLELLCRLGGATPGQVRDAGKPKPVPAAAPEPVDASDLVSVVRRGSGARLVPREDPDRMFDGDRPTSTVKDKDEYLRRGMR